MADFHLLNLTRMPILDQLRLEEALLRTDERNWCLINRGSSPAIVMGISGKEEKLIESEVYNKAPIPIIRRFSGGGTVVVDDNTLFVSFICNHHIESKPLRFPSEIMCWTKGIYEPVVKKDFRLIDHDYALRDRKFGGNAQHICRTRFVHHSTLLWDYCSDRMRYLKLPEKRPAYRGDRSHEDFLCKLSLELDCEQEEFIENILSTLGQKHAIHEAEIPVIDQPHRQATQLC